MTKLVALFSLKIRQATDFASKLKKTPYYTGFLLVFWAFLRYNYPMNGKQNSLIHWFPGHMTKSLREMEGVLSVVDVVLYVLDARAPFSCLNPSFDNIVGGKPVIFVLNKSDLITPNALKQVQNKMLQEGKTVVAINSTASGASKAIMPLVEKLAKDKLEKYKAKGVKVPLRGMVIGVPNSGKSTLINNLCNKGKAVTGNKPGVTRGQQWVRATDYFELLDTPGTLYPKITDQKIGLNLAYIGSIKTEVLDTLEIAGNLAERLLEIAPNELKARYNIVIEEIENESIALEQTGDFPKTKQELMLERVALARGHIQKGGITDIEKASVALLDDFRKGRLGKVMLEQY